MSLVLSLDIAGPISLSLALGGRLSHTVTRSKHLQFEVHILISFDLDIPALGSLHHTFRI
jgi:hypothetical protein